MTTQLSGGGLGCPHCGAQNPPQSLFCIKCGASLSTSEGALGPTSVAEPALSHNVCPRCQVVNQPGSVHCYSCGLPMEGDFPSPAGALTGARPAGFWIRLVAHVIDWTVLIAAVIIVLALLPGIPLAETLGKLDGAFTVGDGLDSDFLMLAFSGAYFVVAVSVWSTTAGKRVFGLHVLRPDGSKVGPGRALARWVAYWLSSLLLFVGYLMIAFRSDKRGLHDLICDTVVVKR